MDRGDYILSLNTVSNWVGQYKKIINYCVFNSCDSVSLAEKIVEILLLILKTQQQLKAWFR